MRIGLTYDLKETLETDGNAPPDALEEYDSRETVALLTNAIEAGGHSVVGLGGGRDFLNNILQEKVDLVFNIAEGRGNYVGREAQVPSVLEMLDIPYSGSGPQCLAICLDKPLTKQLVAAAGVPTPHWQVISNSGNVSGCKLNFPAIIKPANEGSSKGIRGSSLVSSHAEAVATIAGLLDSYQQPMMIEEFIPGDEITVGIIGNTPPRVFGVMQILPRDQDINFVYSLEVKRDYLNLVDYECPAYLDEKTLSHLTAASLIAFTTLGCRDFARLDFRISPDGTPYFIELNPLPGLGTHSDLVIMALKLGWSYEALIAAVLQAAIERQSPRVAAR